MRFFLRHGAFNITFLQGKCVLYIDYFCMFFLYFCYPNKSIEWPIVGLFYAGLIYKE
mgnify:CR=1 FL=1